MSTKGAGGVEGSSGKGGTGEGGGGGGVTRVEEQAGSFFLAGHRRHPEWGNTLTVERVLRIKPIRGAEALVDAGATEAP